MSTPDFRVTVEDLKTGDRQVAELFAGDYLLTTFDPCHLAGEVKHPDTHVLTVKGYRPQGKPRGWRREPLLDE